MEYIFSTIALPSTVTLDFTTLEQQKRKPGGLKRTQRKKVWCQPRKKKIMSDNIPSGVMTEILGRLSWCELCRLRCVCKEWRSILDEPSFIQRQLKRSTSLFLRVQKDYRCYVSYGFQPGTFCPDRLEEGWHGRYVYSVMGSCHGLVCLADFENQLRLVNPVFPEEKQSVTLEHLMTRDPLLSTHDVYFDANYFDIDEDYLLSSVEWAGYGFGYDEVARDYKAVILLTAGSEEYHDLKSYILTYSFRTRSFSVCHANRNWNRSATKNQEMGVLLGGSLHWILEPHVIHSYDLGSDVFGKIQQPKYTAHEVSSSSIVKVGVGVVDSCFR
ncbi:unnamed protein product [Linum tenue]|uniref:F-box domain-containing protein n=1 Tax=Linum tenue TaxID=586396 RepID=A0AAV0HR16_9ROSI|nr:unnamed protein product [Linum tenue]